MNVRRFKVSMLAYTKTILGKMQFSRKLMLKEYRKSLAYLTVEEQCELRKWMRGIG